MMAEGNSTERTMPINVISWMVRVKLCSIMKAWTSFIHSNPTCINCMCYVHYLLGTSKPQPPLAHPPSMDHPSTAHHSIVHPSMACPDTAHPSMAHPTTAHPSMAHSGTAPSRHSPSQPAHTPPLESNNSRHVAAAAAAAHCWAEESWWGRDTGWAAVTGRCRDGKGGRGGGRGKLRWWRQEGPLVLD